MSFFKYSPLRISPSKMSTIPGIKANWNLDAYTEDEIMTKTDELIEKHRLIQDEIAEMKFEDVTYENVIQKLIDMGREFAIISSPISYIKHLSTKQDLRNSSMAASQKLADFCSETSTRKVSFDKIVYFQEKNEFKMDAMNPEVKRLIESVIKLGKRDGLHLPHDTQQKIDEVRERSNELLMTYQHNLNEENTILEFSENQLEGMPDDFMQTLEKLENGKLKVTLIKRHFFPIMQKCRVAETRRVIDKAYYSRCIDKNVPILEEVIPLLQKGADLLNYPTSAAYVTEMAMAKTPEAVHKFLTELQEKLKPLWAEEEKVMLDFKRQECEELGIKFDNKLNFWDLHYYTTMVEEKLYAVDHNKLKEYFPLNVVTKGLLEIFQELLGLKFELVTQDEKWHLDVQMYRVNDAETAELLGYFYLDLFPREGKFGLAATLQPQPGCSEGDGKRQCTVSAMLANFTRPTQDKPSLLNHQEVKTYFQGFGHVMHQICARTELVSFSGTNVEHDFLEVTSQIFENWVWQSEPLKRISAHYKDNVQLPDEMIEKLKESRKANAGIRNLKHIVLALFDQAIHTSREANTEELFSKLFFEVIGILPTEGTNMAGYFYHLVCDYGARYYGYLWSEVFSCDMFASRFEKEGIMNPKVGRDFRKMILEPGGSKDADVMLREFLGRDPNQTAFLESKGIKM